ncbi:penicillin-binding protein 2 [Candidatus Azambacteria bacterium]|nr:penicillin-binding protein 2 [Candidatus Azambacteria bacterium]
MTLKTRLKIIYFVFFFVTLVIIGRFFNLQILKNSFFENQSLKQSEKNDIVTVRRGEIFMTDKSGQLFPLAQNKDWFLVYAIPKEISDPQKTAQEISKILDLDEQLIFKKLSNGKDLYELIKRKISDQEVEKFKQVKIKGIYLDKESGRFYPNNELASQVVGFLSLKDNTLKGQYGLEEYYNKELSGESGQVISLRDVFGTWISVVDKKISKPSALSSDLILTIDPNIQIKIEEELKKLIEAKKASGGTVIVMNPKTGDILGMASSPSFDPNIYQQSKNIKVFLNPATQSVYEPGSIFKAITFAAGLNEKVITPETTYYDSGILKIGIRTIRNYDGRSYGESTMTKVLENSINTGAVFVGNKVGQEKFLEYVKIFGFDRKSGVDLFETTGNISNLKTGREINYATASFGQGISVTPISLITAVSAIANNGLLVKPHLLRKLVKSNGETTNYNNNSTTQVISQESALTLTSLLINVVENGSSKAAKMKGYSVAGKTGTAQIPNYVKGGYTDESIHTFVGYTPAIDPKFIILLKLEKPNERAASTTVVPTFRNIAEYALNYFEIPPDRAISGE